MSELGFIPETAREIDNVRERCRRTVRKRAVLAAGVSAVPIPGVDVVSDLSLFAKLVDEVNQAFGLTPEQIDRLKPKHKLIAYQAAMGVGGMLVGKLVSRELLMAVFKRVGVKSAAKSAAKFVPFAGQVVAAGIGYAVFRHLGYQHVEACASVAKQLRAAGPGD
ncbi:hypothetical protein [Massilia cavernae]|uniref:hypothetical protein n=1 Tax=Massilia cavernae TaxID=2320864 RepID=UPI001E2A0D1B|nr:hypothetical protein [Massilia cavernae]